MSDIKTRLEKLRSVINRHRYLYHVLDKSEISESALDSLKAELTELEKQHPQYITSDSPTQRIGGRPLNKFLKVNHKVRQWSFGDAFTEQDIKEFDERIKRTIRATSSRTILEEVAYACELKIDGLKIVLTYENGILQTAATRGDGVVGENVTQNVKTIGSIPLKLEQPLNVVAEGEIWISKSNFNKLNQEQNKKNLPLFANPRNVAAGSIRQLDPTIAAARKLDSYIYDISLMDKKLPKTQIEELEFLKDLGFKVNKNYKLCKNIDEVISFWKCWMEKKENEDYWIDGVAVKLNRRDWQEELGHTGKSPRFAIAFKFPAEQTTTAVEDIIIQVGRTGALTPVAVLRPVPVAGSIISRVTLHNADEINRLELKIGDTVILQKAGDVIPEIVQVLKEIRSGKEKKFNMPRACPVCGGELIREKTSPIIRCVNKNCSVKYRRALYYFASKKAMNIEGLGPKIIDALLNNNLIQDAADLYDLKEGDLNPLERFGEKSSQNVINSINQRRETTLPKLLIALGIFHIGEGTAQLFAEQVIAKLKNKISKIEDKELLAVLYSLTTNELQKTAGIGPKAAESICDWFQDKQNKFFLEKLLKRISIVLPKAFELIKGKKIKGKTFVLTGTMTKMSREKARKEIILRGGNVRETVSTKTDFIISGDNPGSKYNEAKKLGIKILKEEEFLALL